MKEQREKISKTLTGHKQSQEQIEKRMKKLRGRKMPPGFSEAQSKRKIGYKCSDLHCANIGRSKAKLSDDQVRQIKKLSNKGSKNKDLAIDFLIDPSSISEIVNGKSYRWVV